MNHDFKARLKKSFPQMNSHFESKIDNTLHSLSGSKCSNKTQNRQKRKVLIIVAAVVCICIFASSFTFTINPALATDIPVVNDIVYALSKEKEVDKDTNKKIQDIINDVFNQFANNSTANIGSRFKANDKWMLNENTLYAAYYLQYKAAATGSSNNYKETSYDNICVKNIEAVQRGFSYKAIVTFDILLDEQFEDTDNAIVELEENQSGLYIVSIALDSSEYSEYMKLMEKYEMADNSNLDIDDRIASHNAYIYSYTIMKNEISNESEVTEPREDNQIPKESETPASREDKMKDIAAEFRFRYYSMDKNSGIPDVSDIMIHNNETDLVYHDLQLCLDRINMGFWKPSAIVEKGNAEIIEIISDSKGIIKAKMYVRTVIDGGVGEEIVFTFKEEYEEIYIIGYDVLGGDGQYMGLKGAAERYKKKGYSITEANKKAYEDSLKEATDTYEELKQITDWYE